MATGEQRIKHLKQKIAEIEAGNPLKRPLLEALSQKPLTLGQVSSCMDIITPQAQLLLSELSGEYAIELNDKHRYQLTPEGVMQLSRHRAFGAPVAPPEPPSVSEIQEFLRSAYTRALKIQARDPAEGQELLLIILEQAQKIEATELIRDVNENLVVVS